MLSMTVNQVKVDAGPLITRFKDAETGNLVYAGMFSPVRWWRLWATLWVSNLLFSVVVGAPGFLLLRFGSVRLPIFLISAHTGSRDAVVPYCLVMTEYGASHMF